MTDADALPEPRRGPRSSRALRLLSASIEDEIMEATPLAALQQWADDIAEANHDREQHDEREDEQLLTPSMVLGTRLRTIADVMALREASLEPLQPPSSALVADDGRVVRLQLGFNAVEALQAWADALGSRVDHGTTIFPSPPGPDAWHEATVPDVKGLGITVWCPVTMSETEPYTMRGDDSGNSKSKSLILGGLLRRVADVMALREASPRPMPIPVQFTVCRSASVDGHELRLQLGSNAVEALQAWADALGSRIVHNDHVYPADNFDPNPWHEAEVPDVHELGISVWSPVTTPDGDASGAGLEVPR